MQFNLIESRYKPALLVAFHGAVHSELPPPPLPRLCISHASKALSRAVGKRQEEVRPDSNTAARFFDAELDSLPGSPGPAESELHTYNSGKAAGLIAGAYGAMPSAFDDTTDLFTS